MASSCAGTRPICGAAFPAILSTKDIFDGHNEHVLVQSF